MQKARGGGDLVAKREVGRPFQGLGFGLAFGEQSRDIGGRKQVVRAHGRDPGKRLLRRRTEEKDRVGGDRKSLFPPVRISTENVPDVVAGFERARGDEAVLGAALPHDLAVPVPDHDGIEPLAGRGQPRKAGGRLPDRRPVFGRGKQIRVSFSRLVIPQRHLFSPLPSYQRYSPVAGSISPTRFAGTPAMIA